MADFIDFMGLEELPEHILCIGPESLITDHIVRLKSRSVDLVVPVGTSKELTQIQGSLFNDPLYIIKNPTNWERVYEFVRTVEKVVVLTGSTHKDEFFKKTRSLITKKGRTFTLSDPTTAKARQKTLEFFMFKWGVPRKTTSQVMDILDWNIRGLFNLNGLVESFRSRTSNMGFLPDLIPMVNTRDMQELAVSAILTGGEVPLVDPETAYAALQYLIWAVNCIGLMRYHLDQGVAPSVKSLSSATKLPVTSVLKFIHVVEEYSCDRIDSCRQILAYGHRNKEQPDVLRVMGEIW